MKRQKRKMRNAEEIDAWYEDEKQRILNRYLKGLEEEKNRKHIQAVFSNDMKKLHREYEKRYATYKKHFSLKKLKSILKK